jgi:hypothetical protein
MRHRSSLALFVALSVPLGAVGAQPPIQAQIGGVAIGSTRAQVEQTLGSPSQVLSTGDALDPEIRYVGLTIWLWDRGKVAQIRSTDSKYCVVDRVCPESEAAAVRAILGPPQEGSQLGEGVNSYLTAAEACWVELIVLRGVVSSLEIKCQP